MFDWKAIAAAAILAPGVASAQGLSLDVDPFASAEKRVCWRMPSGTPRRAFDAMTTALQTSAEQTRPLRAATEWKVEQSAQSDCDAVVTGRRRTTRTADGFAHQLELRVDGAAQVQTETSPFYPMRATAADFAPFWDDVWAVLAPEPPPPPPEPPEPPPTEPTARDVFVDEELAATRDRPKLKSTDPAPILTALLLTGVTSRSLSSDVGRPIDQTPLFALGGRAELHLGSRLIGAGHMLDLEGDYWRQFASARLGDQDLGAEADRARVGLRHAAQWFGVGPSFGPAVGFEYRRFTFAEGTGALSLEYSVIRPGLFVRQPLFRAGALQLDVEADGRARIALADGVDIEPSFDISGALALRHEVGFVALLGASYSAQSGQPSNADVGFDDGFFDAHLSVGWSL